MKKSLVPLLISFLLLSYVAPGFCTQPIGNESPTMILDSEDDEFLDAFDDGEPVSDSSVSDPLYYLNYSMYAFNDLLYFYALKPVARGYKFVVPTVVRKGVRNFFHNIAFPIRLVNNLLQGQVRFACDEVGVFLVNTTAGGLGFWQVAQNYMDLDTHNEDLGQTLGKWQLGEGIYLVLPFLGPSSFRDSIGTVGDYFLTPGTYVLSTEVNAGVSGLEAVNGTSFRIGDYEALKAASLDPYQALKNAYIQRRRAMVDNLEEKKEKNLEGEI